MYGKRSNSGALEALALYDGYVFNSITWNPSASNTILVSQQIIRATALRGTGSGKKKIACPASP